MAVDNNTILGKALLQGTNDFAQRIPDPSQAGIKATMDALFDPLNNQLYNQFVDILVNRIGFTLVRQQAFKNPLAVFKGQKLYYGSTAQELMVGWIKAHSYQDDAETLLKLHRPEIVAAYHSINRQDQYPISINRVELRQAFAEEYGLNNLVAGVMQAPVNSDEYDEYKCMLQLIGEYDHRWGFFKHQLSAAPTTQSTAEEFLAAARTYVGKFAFPSSRYSAAGVPNIPVFAKPEECVLFVTPEVAANVSVHALASMFHTELADVNVRMITVDEFPIPEAVALLTTQDFYQCYDQEYSTGSFYNPQTMSTNYFLNHISALSVSPFVPAVLFTTSAGTTTPTITMTPATLTVTAASATAEAGSTVQLTPVLAGSVTANDIDVTVQPVSAVSWAVAVSAANTEKTSRTWVDRNNVLHIQGDLEANDTVTVTGVSTYLNPSGATSAIAASPVTITIV